MALVGVEGHVVQVEVHIGGLPGFALVGRPDAALVEARDRVRAAILCSGEPWPQQRITVNLSPASIPKRGTHFDLSMALAILGAAQRLPVGALDGLVVLGEVGLDGAVRSVPGVLPAVLAAHRAGFCKLVVPASNAPEARLVPGLEIVPAGSLAQVIAVLRGAVMVSAPEVDRAGLAAPVTGAAGPGRRRPAEQDTPDLADVRGQLRARQAVEVAAAGHHHLSLTGPPGTGKTMIARRIPGLLPDLDHAEALEVTAVHSLAGLLPPDRPLVTRPPLADPHHTASAAAVVGGGSRLVRPGAAACAHRGVLLLDEAPEFSTRVLESLRQPLEHGQVVVDRADFSARFPARFLLVLAANPCPCGYHGSATHVCQCTPETVRRYRMRLSGPLLDRVDIRIRVHETRLSDLREGGAPGEPSAAVAARVCEARDRQRRRYAGSPWTVNGDVPGPVLRRRFPPEAGSMAVVEEGLARGTLSARGADRVLRVAWTVADLRGTARPGPDDVMIATTLRLGEAA